MRVLEKWKNTAVWQLERSMGIGKKEVQRNRKINWPDIDKIFLKNT